jgi:hypothetical protein
LTVGNCRTTLDQGQQAIAASSAPNAPYDLQTGLLIERFFGFRQCLAVKIGCCGKTCRLRGRIGTAPGGATRPLPGGG